MYYSYCLLVCGELGPFTGSTGTFYSVNYPSAYNYDNIDCRYLIRANGTGTTRIILAFSEFVTEQNADFVEVILIF